MNPFWGQNIGLGGHGNNSLESTLSGDSCIVVSQIVVLFFLDEDFKTFHVEL